MQLSYRERFMMRQGCAGFSSFAVRQRTAAKRSPEQPERRPKNKTNLKNSMPQTH